MKIHIVQKGETLWKIAKKYGIDFTMLKAANTQLKNFDKIMPGDKIKVPTEGKEVKKKLDFPKMPFKKEAPIKLEFPIKKEVPIKKEAPIVKQEIKKEKPVKPLFPIKEVKEEPVKKPYIQPKIEAPKPVMEAPIQQPVYPGIKMQAEECVPMTGLLPGSGLPGDCEMPHPMHYMEDYGCEPQSQMPYGDDCGCDEQPWQQHLGYGYDLHDMMPQQGHYGYAGGMMPQQGHYGYAGGMMPQQGHYGYAGDMMPQQGHYGYAGGMMQPQGQYGYAGGMMQPQGQYSDVGGMMAGTMPQGYEQPPMAYPQTGMMQVQYNPYPGMGLVMPQQYGYQQQMPQHYFGSKMGSCGCSGQPVSDSSYGYSGQMGMQGYGYPVQQTGNQGYGYHEQQMWGSGYPGIDFGGAQAGMGVPPLQPHGYPSNEATDYWQTGEMPQGTIENSMGYPKYDQEPTSGNSLDAFWDIDVDFKPGSSRDLRNLEQSDHYDDKKEENEKE